MSPAGNREQSDKQQVPEPQGRLLGMPYDIRRPTIARARARLWNSADRRLFTPKTFGWGYDVNFYWLAHPARYLKSDR
jgi:hypothetical protein